MNKSKLENMYVGNKLDFAEDESLAGATSGELFNFSQSVFSTHVSSL